MSLAMGGAAIGRPPPLVNSRRMAHNSVSRSAFGEGFVVPRFIGASVGKPVPARPRDRMNAVTTNLRDRIHVVTANFSDPLLEIPAGPPPPGPASHPS